MNIIQRVSMATRLLPQIWCNRITRTFSLGTANANRKPPIDNKTPVDRWDEEHALFGENDFKDILGDGSYKLRKNVNVGPWWIRGWKGSEFEMLVRKRKFIGKDMGPIAYKDMMKRIDYLFKKMNRNRGYKRNKKFERKRYDF
ncbi:large ribosomal subunit protein mL51-like [Ptychodera flava]|uniref:large ribosomal subunit protein mL51-like n=1 Tax=Ptychodera flava TaxID=63121 RepID=UPI00396A39CE